MAPAAGGFYRGWYMVACGIVATMIVVGSTTYAFGILVASVSQDLGLSRSEVNQGLVFQHLGVAVITPLVGRLLDRWSLRSIMALSAILLGGSFALMGQGDGLLPKAFLLAVPIPFAIAGGGALASYVLVARWFVANRGRAMALVALGQSAGSVFYAPLLAMGVAQYGWRDALLIEGGVVFLILFGISRLMEEGPRPGTGEPGVEVEGGAHTVHGRAVPLKAILGRVDFWLLLVPISVTLGVIQTLLATIVPLAIERGIDLVRASTLISLLGISGLCGKMTLAWIADKVDRMLLLIGCIVINVVFVLSLTVNAGYAFMAFNCILCGLALGTFFPIYSATLADRFGARALGTAEGAMSPAIAGTTAFALWLAGRFYDATGSYNLIFLVFAGALGVAGGFAVALQRRTVANFPENDFVALKG